VSERRDEGIDPELVATRAWDARLVARLAGFARPHAAQFARSLLVLALLFAVELTGPYVWRLVLDGPVGGALSGRLSRWRRPASPSWRSRSSPPPASGSCTTSGCASSSTSSASTSATSTSARRARSSRA
jgi:hypothetical protein